MNNLANHRILPVSFNNFHLYLPVVQQYNFVGLHILGEGIIGNIYLIIVADTFVGSNIDTGAVNQVYSAVFYQTYADLRPLQVGQDTYICFILFIYFTDGFNYRLVVLRFSMRKIKA